MYRGVVHRFCFAGPSIACLDVSQQGEFKSITKIISWGGGNQVHFGAPGSKKGTYTHIHPSLLVSSSAPLGY
jgi:hypothetical protein